MTQLALSIPQSGQLNSTEDVKVANDLTAIQSVVNGSIDMSNIATGIVLQLAVVGSTRKVAFGTGTVTFPGGDVFSNTVTVTHGLGTTPLVVVANMKDKGTSSCFFITGTWTSTTFAIQGQQTGTTVATSNFSWLAIG